MGKSERAGGQKSFLTVGSSAETAKVWRKKVLTFCLQGHATCPYLEPSKSKKGLPSSFSDINFNIILPFVTRSSQ
jgi:hypothetical protein